jgi:hypothetical protein
MVVGLFADEHAAKIGDFGLAGVAAEKAETRGEIWGTHYYVAAERLNNQLARQISEAQSIRIDDSLPARTGNLQRGAKW